MASPFVLLKTGLFSALVPGTVAGLVPWFLARRDQLTLPIPSSVARAAGLGSLLAGIALYAHTAWRFSDEGGGTPSPADEPPELVTGGVYRYVRNPMYVAVLLCIGGQALLYRSVLVAWWAAGCWLGFHNRVLEYEEPHLAAKHGAEYDEYRRRVPRWIPRPP
ncbi:isoprenylcysteine carboxylmethyltransferase family protein [Natronococcus sp. A-GB7]|uniref:methyltransferase family protein n=1 Tax=Natronococcus sp. A-GB7 TaxID=3037649 RepID=UPI00241F8862|nr:isoprenylcysteine carboxylmethyltransferase family protein [Natronococcus sp. A-GB7]MDG5819099.1 isoprenylcysteine carboxylmethyltransferase family protein [Natronococcus sp. A-GB7]